MDVRLVQSRKASLSIWVTPEGNVMDVRFVQARKALLPIWVTEDGRDRDLKRHP